MWEGKVPRKSESGVYELMPTIVVICLFRAPETSTGCGTLSLLPKELYQVLIGKGIQALRVLGRQL